MLQKDWNSDSISSFRHLTFSYLERGSHFLSKIQENYKSCTLNTLMEQVAEVSADSFGRVITESNKPVIVEFWIRSCSSCQKFKPIYEQLPQIFGHKIKVLKMNMFLSLENLKLAESFGVEETPTIKFFCVGREIGEIVGFRPLEKVVNEIKEILEREDYCQKTLKRLH